MAILTLGELLKLPPNPAMFIVKPLLPQYGTMVIGAETKSFKSMLALNLAYDIAEGLPFLGLYGTLKPQRVLYFDQELGPWGAQKRMQSLHAHRQGIYADNYLMFVNKDLTLRLDSEAGLARICEYIDQAKADVVIYDPLQYFHSQDENDNGAAKELMRKIHDINATKKVSSVIVHHFGKASKERSSGGLDRLRGASSVMDMADAGIGMEKLDTLPGRPPRVNLVFKLRHDAEPPPTKLEYVQGNGSFTVIN